MHAPRRVVVTGVGLLCAIGNSLSELVSSLRVSRSGIDWVEAHPLSKRFPAGVIRQQFNQGFSRTELPYLDRCQQLAIAAAGQAVEDAGYQDFAEFGPRAGLYYGSVSGGANFQQDWCRQYLVEGRQASSPFSAMAIMQNAGAAQVSIRRQIRGPVLTYNTACASSGVALGEAQRAIGSGQIDVAVAGGAEACLVAGMLGMFDGTRALAAGDPVDVERSCTPFSAHRRGLVLAEGAAFLVLESEPLARARGATIYGYLSGYAATSDAYHVGAPHAPGQAIAMCRALDDAGLSPSDIGYVNAHATATAGGDVVECDAIRTVFQANAADVPVSSTKSMHGHLMGAASALELIICLAAIRERMLPATAHLEEIDPRCDVQHVPRLPVLDRQIRHAMSFSAGFGGTNCALIVSAA